MFAKRKPEALTLVSFTVPYLTPPTVNHYKEPVTLRLSGGKTRRSYAVTEEGKAFKAAVAMFARGETVAPAEVKDRKKVRYGLYITVVHGKGERGDGDNYWKCIADGLQEAGVIHSDSRVKVWNLLVDDEDRGEPRTEIRVKVLSEQDWKDAKEALRGE